MSEFIYQEPFPIECDKTQYRLLTKEYVKIVECDGRRILKVDPKGIELLAAKPIPTYRSTCARPIWSNSATFWRIRKASDNDKFVAYTMLLNQTVAAESELPTCQDTGTAIWKSARRARMSLRERTTPNVSPGAPTKPTRSATCAIRRWCPSR